MIAIEQISDTSVRENAAPGDGLTFRERDLTPELLKSLIKLSVDWEGEDSCWGYRRNTEQDITGNRIFVAERGSELVGYLFGHIEAAKNSTSIMQVGTAYFEVEELYVIPECRGRDVGRFLFASAEQAMVGKVEYVLLSTATITN